MFDIITRWDKRYALKHFPETNWDVFFVGDRCHPDNDYEIYDHCTKGKII